MPPDPAPAVPPLRPLLHVAEVSFEADIDRANEQLEALLQRLKKIRAKQEAREKKDPEKVRPIILNAIPPWVDTARVDPNTEDPFDRLNGYDPPEIVSCPEGYRWDNVKMMCVPITLRTPPTKPPPGSTIPGGGGGW